MSSSRFPAGFQDLVLDIQIYLVSYFLNQSEIYSILLVNKHFHALVLPVLYSTSDITSANYRRGPGCASRLRASQSNFTRNVLIRHPAYAPLVRSLAWEVNGFDESLGNPFTTLFPKLENVTSLHLIDAHPTFLANRGPSFQFPSLSPHSARNIITSKLFPKIRDISLTGRMSTSYLMPILHTPSGLHSLTLEAISPVSTLVDLLMWIGQADLVALRKLSIRGIAVSLDGSDGEVLEALNHALVAVQRSVSCLTLQFVPHRKHIGGDGMQTTRPPLAQNTFWNDLLANGGKGGQKVLKYMGLEWPLTVKVDVETLIGPLAEKSITVEMKTANYNI